MLTARYAALKVLLKVIRDKQSLTEALEPYQTHPQKSLISELCYGVCRFYYGLKPLLTLLLSKPLKAKDNDIELVLLMGLYQLKFMRLKDFAVVNETVKLVSQTKKIWAKGLINGVLRQYIRQAESLHKQLADNLEFQYGHPGWLLELFKEYQLPLESICHANNQKAPIYLRVNTHKISIADYIAALSKLEIEVELSPEKTGALKLISKVNVAELPYFQQGYVFVQDLAAQMASELLDLQNGTRVLDACSAPGGKLTAILESNKHFKEVIALDNNPARIDSIYQNLERLKLSAKVIEGDAAQVNDWWDGKPFDRILVDAPCSAVGVIRRHPDIKILRAHSAVVEIVKRQQTILDALWPLLKAGGRLVYATCSILPIENELQIEAFLKRHQDAVAVPFNLAWGDPRTIGWQFLPGKSDGFYYAILEKMAG